MTVQFDSVDPKEGGGGTRHISKMAYSADEDAVFATRCCVLALLTSAVAHGLHAEVGGHFGEAAVTVAGRARVLAGVRLHHVTDHQVVVHQHLKQHRARCSLLCVHHHVSHHQVVVHLHLK